MRLSPFITLLALASQMRSGPAAAQVAPDVLAPARQHLLREEYAAASASYQQALPRGGSARDYYQAARAAARNQEPKRALAWLTQAVEKGYFTEDQLCTEEDFASLAARPTWPRLLASARTKQQRHEAPFAPKLVALLKQIRYHDQHYRQEATAAERKYGLNAPQMIEAMAAQTRIDQGLSRQVDSLLAIHGYPGRSLVGEYQKNVAFFVVQHNPDEKYRPMLMAAADKQELSWSALALLIDRLNGEAGQPQVYGSQLGAVVNGHYTLLPIEDEPNVNVRRTKVGLEPLEEYLHRYKLAYQVPTATLNPNPAELYTPLLTARPSGVELIGSYEALRARLQYPAAAAARQVQGNVTLELVVDKAGFPQHIAVVKGLGYGCDEEAVRVMQTARYQNLAGQDHAIRVSLPFPYSPAENKEEK
ncbi:TonB family protein [Hymenobacter psychrophilus]|uniref:TonB family C-terminal domain-containing protein n=1 Tax=Hymenobacter psychrophilus TaxID=651662 RepID=A0A1H3NIN5_9BACT|nr:TonB family protein [Hymenobacter psychrophilus]SDY88786.1 TonB family C-terminal domain-containing protein [Hymenobacter psychrophilus]